MNLTRSIIARHLVSGEMTPGAPIGLRIDQTLTQDATGTMAWLQFEALGLDRVRVERAVSYVDHNTLQTDFRNPDDHRFLRTMAARYGAVFSPAGLGICHQLHLENFARPGATLIGSDSHTPTAGGLASLAMGAGGLSVALAMAGEAYEIPMPKVLGIRLSGRLRGWATAKDVILELLRRLSVKGGVGRVLEYTGPGVATLSVPDRATIANMGAELGATASIFPSDANSRAFLASMGRVDDWVELLPPPDAVYDEELELDLDALVPLAACPHMPDRVVPVADLVGLGVDQVCIGSCTNSSYADLSQVAALVAGKRVAPATDTLIAPGSRQVLALLAGEGPGRGLDALLGAGVRLLECVCGPCIGTGGAPVSQGVSVRTFNRNFEGRSGTRDAKVYLASPVTAAKAALHGAFTDPAGWGTPPARPELLATAPSIRHLFVFAPDDPAMAEPVQRGPNIVALEPFAPLPNLLDATVTIRLDDNITTDHIMPAGAEILALRSNVPAISRHVFARVDPDFPRRAEQSGSGIIVAGENYGQGSSREHAALAPRHLGIRAVLAKSFARIHAANLINFGIIPLVFADPADHDRLPQGATIRLDTQKLLPDQDLTLAVRSEQGECSVLVRHTLSAGDIAVLKAGGLLNRVRAHA